MAWKKAETIILSEKQRYFLENFAKGTHVPLHLKVRSNIILRAAEGISNNKISKDFGINRESVIRWRSRYLAAFDSLTKFEIEGPKKLKLAIVTILSDEPRPGHPSTFTDVQKAAIIALSLKNPVDAGYPFSHWTPDSLKEAAIEQKIVESISASQVSRFLKSAGFETTQSAGMVKSEY
jgi:putative transposase